MDPLTAGIAGGASLIGGWMSNEATEDRMHEQMAFQERMRDTAYQATMKDMKKAGLNPILAYQRGPTSSPTGAFAAATDMITPAVNSAFQNAKVQKETENIESTNPLIAEQIRTQRSIQEANQATARRQLADADVADVEVGKRKSEAITAGAEAVKSGIDEEMYKKLPWLRTLGTAGHEVGRVTGAVFPAVNSGANVSRAMTDRATFKERFGVP